MWRNMIGAVFLQQYQAVTLLGRGAMGTVYLARHLTRPEVVVVKVIKKEHARRPDFRRFFDREIESLAALKHPHIVALHASDFDDPNGPCLVMEYIPGVTLERLLEKHKLLPPERVYRLLVPLCRALAYGHARQVTHRDLKPANLMVTEPDAETESLKVMDFGLSQLAAKPHIPLERLHGHAAGSLCGTPLYVAPEGLRGDVIDHRADLYSVGVTLFELLTGTRPFNYNEVQTVLKAHLSEPPPRLAEAQPGLKVPPGVEAVVRRCLEKYPNERPQTARDLAAEFARALGAPFNDAVFPPEDAAPPPAPKAVVTPPPPELTAGGPHTVSGRFDAWMPEPIAVMKLRGFVQDHAGRILDSEPGRIRVHFPAGATPAAADGKGLLGWFASKAAADRWSGSDPIEMLLYLARTDRSGRLGLTVVLQPPAGQRPARPAAWHPRCQQLLTDFRAYFMAK